MQQLMRTRDSDSGTIASASATICSAGAVVEEIALNQESIHDAPADLHFSAKRGDQNQLRDNDSSSKPTLKLSKMYCGLCGEPCKRQRWDLCCRKYVEGAERDADRKGERQYLEDQKKDPVTFKALMDNYRKECPAPGRGKKRKDFDWIQQKKLTSK